MKNYSALPSQETHYILNILLVWGIKSNRCAKIVANNLVVSRKLVGNGRLEHRDQIKPKIIFQQNTNSLFRMYMYTKDHLVRHRHFRLLHQKKICPE